ncbi:hypothetical protein [Bdellovibrio sp. HCB337]|uniref:hypothetical protein n=1 Tax=Bdellovibrio sp. HCB337 TaxID=3394358 RepID=UPI0039A42D82
MFVYHRIPEHMNGTTLYPLSQLRSLHPQVFDFAAQKYKGRETVMEQTVGVLNCKWNDVIHLTPLDPKETLRALREAGGSPASTNFWKIPVEMLDEDSTVYFSYKATNAGFEKEYSRFSKSKYKEMNVIPEKTFEYYQKAYAEGGRPLMYHLVPHILTSRPIDITSVEICSW